MRLRYLLFFALLLHITNTVKAQDPVIIKGQVTDHTGQALPYAYVLIKPLGMYTATDTAGHYLFTGILPGQYSLSVKYTGFIEQEYSINVSAGQTFIQNFQVKENIHSIDVITLSTRTPKSEARKIEESGFQVKAIDASQFENISTDINTVLNQSSGIRIRETGGLGSRFNLYLNGLSGRQIRYFVDGIPIDQLGNIYTLNNFPINLVRRLDIYKGVVPSELGADALGGAVNIITKSDEISFLDASYSLGSFNTNRAALVGAYRCTHNGLTIKTMNYYNYSDNSYTMNNVTVFAEGNEKKVNARRFHDQYVSYMGNLEAGFTRVKWADEFLIGVSYGKIDRDIQHTSYGIPTGEAEAEETNQVYTLKYSKTGFIHKNLSIKAFILKNKISSTSTDTSSNRYNWLGEIIRTEQTGFGELSREKTINIFEQDQYQGRVNLRYKINTYSSLNVNHISSIVTRQGANILNQKNNEIFRSPNQMRSSISGLSYDVNLFNNKWENTFFLKHYSLALYMKNAIEFNTGEFTLQNVNTFVNKLGYGFASRYFLTTKWYIKTSFEKGYRIPHPTEVFGDGMTIVSNPDLQPEHGYNYNLGISYLSGKTRHGIEAHLGLYLRDMSNFIYLTQVGNFSGYYNEMKVLGRGSELDIRYNYNKHLSVSTNFSWQQVLNNVKYIKGTNRESRVYRDQMPNTPYFFCNGQINYRNMKLYRNFYAAVYYSINYIHSFYLSYPSLSKLKTKNSIPTQFISNAGITLSSMEGRYNTSIELRNIFNHAAYDNFNLQKPGRSVFLKLRYYLSRE